MITIFKIFSNISYNVFSYLPQKTKHNKVVQKIYDHHTLIFIIEKKNCSLFNYPHIEISFLLYYYYFYNNVYFVIVIRLLYLSSSCNNNAKKMYDIIYYV